MSDAPYLEGVIAKSRLQSLPPSVVIESAMGQFGEGTGRKLYEGLRKLGGYGDLNFRTAKSERPVLDTASLAGAEAHQIQKVEMKYQTISREYLESKIETCERMLALEKDPAKREQIIGIIDKTKREIANITQRAYAVEHEVRAIKRDIDAARLRWEQAEKFYFDVTRG